MSESIDIALGVLDHQLLDADERRCGKVDDLELEGLDGDTPHVSKIIVGPPAWSGRGRIGPLAAFLARGRRATHIDWSEVVKIDSAVRLRGRARDYGLGRGDDRARPLVEWIPRSK